MKLSNAAIPILEMISGQEKLVIKNSRIQGTVAVHDKITRATLTELRIDYPKLNMTGMFAYDENIQDIRLSLNGDQIDADSVRQTALKLAGRSKII